MVPAQGWHALIEKVSPFFTPGITHIPNIICVFYCAILGPLGSCARQPESCFPMCFIPLLVSNLSDFTPHLLNIKNTCPQFPFFCGVGVFSTTQRFRFGDYAIQVFLLLSRSKKWLKILSKSSTHLKTLWITFFWDRWQFRSDFLVYLPLSRGPEIALLESGMLWNSDSFGCLLPPVVFNKRQGPKKFTPVGPKWCTYCFPFFSSSHWVLLDTQNLLWVFTWFWLLNQQIPLDGTQLSFALWVGGSLDCGRVCLERWLPTKLLVFILPPIFLIKQNLFIYLLNKITAIP